MPTVKQAYKFALDAAPRQQEQLASHCGAARFAFNFGLGLVKRMLDEHEADPCVTVPWGLAALRRGWNQAKHEIAPWWAENSKEAYSSGLDSLARALDAYFRSCDGQRKGPRMGFPGFRRKHTARMSFRFTTGAIRVEPDRHHVTLPKIGRIRTHESTRKLARRTEGGTARLLSATVSKAKGPLARKIADAGWGELRRQLGYKLTWVGGQLVKADRWFPSSKTCSACGLVKAKLPLATRVFHCQACGLRLDPDLNAARNLARVVELVAGSGSGDRKRPWRGRKTRPGRAVPAEAGSQRRADGPGEAGTAEPQGSAA